MRQMLLTTIISMLVVVTTATLPQGIDYSKYDQQKLQQRYNIIQALVRPRAVYKPQRSTAYSHAGHNKAANPYGGYQPNSYAPQPQVGYSTGYATGYANPYAQAPAQYGVSFGGIRFGGGKVHPIFNNALLYKNDQKNLGTYDTTAPIFLGGASKNPATAFRSAQPVNKLSAQIDAYGNRPAPGVAYPYFG